jgi:hypothetical protein
VFRQEAAALREGDRVGEYAIDVADCGSRDGDEIVANAEEGFADDPDLVLEQEVEVFEHGTGKAVFDGDYCGVNGFLDQFFEDLGRKGTGDDYRIFNQT